MLLRVFLCRDDTCRPEEVSWLIGVAIARDVAKSVTKSGWERSATSYRRHGELCRGGLVVAALLGFF